MPAAKGNYVIDRSRRTLFDGAARLYDEARPGYPEQLVEDIITLSEIDPAGRILEIGCGPGKATIPFARRGYAMLCLELGHEMAALAAENCRIYPNIKVENISFEDWPLQARTFDLVISAQAFHWIPPEVGLPKVAAALRTSGSLALFWNHYPAPEGALFQSIQEVYQEEAPDLASPLLSQGIEGAITSNIEAINSSGYFQEVVVRHYPWSMQYTAEQYARLLSTYSDHLSLPEDRRRALLERIGDVIERFGGVLEKPYLATLYWAKMRE
jgi:SAM-dependent methyltransferase